MDSKESIWSDSESDKNETKLNKIKLYSKIGSNEGENTLDSIWESIQTDKESE